MTLALLLGAACGAGVLLVLQAVLRPRPGVAVQVARLDAARRSAHRQVLSAAEAAASAAPQTGLPVVGRLTGRLVDGLADRLEVVSAERGWRLRRTRADLAVLGRSTGAFLATKVVAGLLLLLVVPLCWGSLRLFGVPLPGGVPLPLALVLAAAGFLAPDLALRADAQRRRRDFRRVVGVFSDLVAMNLAGGRGLPEALLASASVSDYWALVRIRQALANARLMGTTPWQALGNLGAELAVDELTDLAGALVLAADDGAKIRASLSARAATLRRREMADTEGEAGEKSQSMLVAQLLLCTAFMVFLAFPAVSNLLGQS
ncbi:type II secretion system F family protein [Kineococcus rubinsiae]|uniref:type II secretion system F family protein n=1 Tax=Kineococcus rubinsiae TaxID=2609562 RepID=UPI0014321910|nr:type II secretion system F family protein [Kineococcus rubinsiae]NIZ93237.1 type II secretion system F family protein [Kineococcus rubinsiae]